MKKMSLKIIAASLALLTTQVQASPVNVGGVVWDPASFFDFTTADQMVETSGNAVGDSIQGFGRITAINGLTNFCSGCELTYDFGGYTITSTAGGQFTFSGGWLNVYVDNSQNFDLSNAASATNGNLWLALAGHTSYDLTSLRTGTLHSDPTPIIAGVQGDGRGYLDVVGGMAQANFNTDKIDVLTGPNSADKADFIFTSSFQLLPNGPFVSGDATYTMFGTNDLQGHSIPEPGSLALIAFGLIGAGALRRRTQG